MEKRLSLYEKLKNIKITKLTLKQANNKTITLNLKEDLLNETIQISDKVLNMLELIAAQKQMQKEQQQQQHQQQQQDVSKQVESTPIVQKPIEHLKNQCRICQLKCLNEKALVEHITRSHASSHSENRRRLQLRLQSANESLATADTSITDLDQSFSQDDSCCSDNQHNKPKTSNVPAKPNVAIRVAKVAYYNSKDAGSSISNQKSSNIFLNGIRGNFFSQERLPLKSCKIKIKDLGSTTSVKLIEQSKINSFFRKLIDYIPIKVQYLDDLIHKYNLDTIKSQYLTKLHQILLESKELGLNLYELKMKSEVKSMNLVMELLNILIDNYLVLRVGVTERVYVTHEFCQSWIIFSYKNQKGRGNLSMMSNAAESISETDESANESTTPNIKRTRRSTQDNTTNPNENSLIDKQYKKVHLIPRPWRYIDGLLNRQVLQKMLESIILYLKSHPDSTFECISLHYCPVLQPVMTLELLEMLIYLDCVKCDKLKREIECTLESVFDNNTTYCRDVDSELGNEICLYECTNNAIFIIKQVFEH